MIKKQINTKRRQEQVINSENYFEKLDECLPKIINIKNNKYLDHAAKIAAKSSMTHKHGAVIVHKNEIIASGYNYSLSYLSHFYSIHAEVAAISKLKKKSKEFLSECEMYVVRIASFNYKGVLKYSKPCENCKKAIAKSYIKKTYYSTNYEYDDIMLNV